MGSDLYMEERNWRPRPNIVEWLDDETVKIQTDYFYHGYSTVYEGKVTPEVETLLKGLKITLPPKPKPEDDPIKVLAAALHESKCRFNHDDGCAWYYEEDEWHKPYKSTNHGWARDMWTNTMRAHQSWYVKAKKVLAAVPNVSAEDILKIARNL